MYVLAGMACSIPRYGVMSTVLDDQVQQLTGGGGLLYLVAERD